MSGVFAGKNVIVAGHGAQVIEGTYVDQRAITFVVPKNADADWLKEVTAVFGLGSGPPTPDFQRFTRIEAQLDTAARRLEALENNVAQKLVHIPHDLSGLRELQKEIEARISVIVTENSRDFSWLIDAPAKVASLAGYRFQRQVYGLTAARTPPIRTRFSDGSFKAYYAAGDPTAALFEAGHFESQSLANIREFAFISVEVRAQRLLDLRDETTRDFVNVHSPGFLNTIVAPGDWGASQRFGKALVQTGFDGCIHPSAISVGRDNMVLFPDNLAANAINIKQFDRLNAELGCIGSNSKEIATS